MFNYSLHVEMWERIADCIIERLSQAEITSEYDAIVFIDDLKEDILIDMEVEEYPFAFCYACDYAYNIIKVQNTNVDHRYRCVYCPLDGWGADKCYQASYSSNYISTTGQGLFNKLCKAILEKDGNEAENICIQISELEVKENIDIE